MGQLLIVHGRDTEHVRRLYDEALVQFRRLHGLQSCGAWRSGDTIVAHFPPLAAAPLKMRSAAEPAAFLCGVGTWFFERVWGERAQEQLWRRIRPAGLGACMQDVEGIFVVAAGNAEGVEFATDRIGTLHFYSCSVGSTRLCSTSLLVLASLTRPGWDMASCREFLATGTVFGQRTLFRGIEKVPPATLTRLAKGEETRLRYWTLADHLHHRAKRAGTVEELASELVSACRAISSAFADPVIDLTGGFDSRAVAAAMLQSRSGFHTVVAGGTDDPDVRISTQIAAQFGLRHERFEPPFRDAASVWDLAKQSLPLVDGESDVLLYARVLAMHRFLAGRHQITLNGSNGEVTKGYWWELLGRSGSWDSRRIAEARFVFEGEVDGLLASEHQLALPDYFAGVIDEANRGLEDAPGTARMDNVYLTLRMQRWQGRIASATCRLWPCASPFLWRGPMEVALAAAPEIRRRHRMCRRLIERLNPKMAALPLADGGPALPLRLDTAYRFLPLAAATLGKAAGKVAALAGMGRASAGAESHATADLWRLEEPQEFLEAGLPASQDLYNKPVLLDFLRRSRGTGFRGSARFGRLVTLELVGRALKANAG